MIHNLGHGVYFIAKKESYEHIHCNAYLVIEGENAVLIEPGNMLDFDVILDDVKSIIDIKKINYVLLSHPDADLTSSMPLFEKELGDYSIITEWRTTDILSFYGLHAPFYHIREHDFHLKLSKDRTLYFHMTPFAHYAGSFVTYDSKSKALLSGDLFGGYSKKWSLFADQEYIESMAMYHENYMPSSDFIRPVMKQLSQMDIEMILPQHGSIIEKKYVKKSIDFLYQLDFYNSSNTVERIVKTNRKYDYPNILAQMVIRLVSLYPENQIKEVFDQTNVEVSFSPIEVTSSLKGYKLWNQFFDIIYSKKGDAWLNYLESLMNKITKTYAIKKPLAYQNRYKKLESKQKEYELHTNQLQDKLLTLQNAYNTTVKQLTTCPITNLPNVDVLTKVLIERNNHNMGLIFIEIDQIEQINRTYDNTVGDNTIKTLAYIVENEQSDNELLFRANGSGVILYVEDSSLDALINRATHLRNTIENSTSFIEKVTAGVGVITDESQETVTQETVTKMITQGSLRVELAHQLGEGEIVHQQTSNKDFFDFTVLLIDEDEININMITKYFQSEQIKLVHAKNPIEAISMIKSKKIHAIISEINLSKLDGFSLKQQLNQTTEFANIPFILISHLKTHKYIDRANELDVNYFLQKPFYPNELIGLIKRLIQQ